MDRTALTTLLITTLLIAHPSWAEEQPAAATRAGSMPLEISVYRSATCGCCKSWIEHLEANGFTVRDHVEEDMSRIKTRFGVPRPAQSCHTAKIGDYVIEGHVPAEDIKRVLAEKLPIHGLAVPGMVVGSPGMEMGDRKDPFAVIALERDGGYSLYRSYRNY
ncbi:MAG: DUF411 domain-containing protein [Gammaproteobacteria bacterium]